jgi:hypothetical protein
MAGIRDSLEKDPRQYTSWFLLAFPRIAEWWEQRYGNKRT